MGEIKLLKANVGHARLWPKSNSFLYKVFYLILPVNKDYKNRTGLFSLNKINVFSVYNQDHGAKDKNISWEKYINEELDKINMPTELRANILLICHPRIFGYAFNPISYWLVLDDKDNLRAVLCEVRNTFKQNHNYLLYKKNFLVIKDNDTLKADKKLYVSPYTKIEGHYEFNFGLSDQKFKSVINYFDSTGKQILNTYMGGNIESIDSKKIIKTIFSYPFMTLMVVFRIHWQALKLLIKRVKITLNYKPKKYENNKTST